MLYGIEVRQLGGPWKMGYFVLVLLNPPGNNTCLVDWSIVILKDTPPSREEMLHHGMQMIAQDGNIALCINLAFKWNDLTNTRKTQLIPLWNRQNLLLLEPGTRGCRASGAVTTQVHVHSLRIW